jgi:hypothetical protein
MRHRVVLLNLVVPAPLHSSLDEPTTRNLMEAMDNLCPTAAIALAVVIVAWFGYIKPNHQDKKPLPPSPRSDPIIGHLRILPEQNEHVLYREWGRQLKSTFSPLDPGDVQMIAS